MRGTRRTALGTTVAAVTVLGVSIPIASPAFAADGSATAVKSASSRHSVSKFVGDRVHVALADHFEDILQGALSDNLKLIRGVKETDSGLRFNGGEGKFDHKTWNFTESLHGQLVYVENGPNGTSVKITLKDFKIVKHGRTGEVLTNLELDGGTPATVVDQPLTWATFKLPTVTFSKHTLTVKNAPLTLTSEALQLFSRAGQPETNADLGTTSFSIPVR